MKFPVDDSGRAGDSTVAYGYCGRVAELLVAGRFPEGGEDLADAGFREFAEPGRGLGAGPGGRRRLSDLFGIHSGG
ncbi:hypothetical protein ACWCQN_23365 [Streptomyces sp. NPDC001984]